MVPAVLGTARCARRGVLLTVSLSVAVIITVFHRRGCLGTEHPGDVPRAHEGLRPVPGLCCLCSWPATVLLPRALCKQFFDYVAENNWRKWRQKYWTSNIFPGLVLGSLAIQGCPLLLRYFWWPKCSMLLGLTQKSTSRVLSRKGSVWTQESEGFLRLGNAE